MDFNPDLILEEHRTALLSWLNAWGCRQFIKKDHTSASSEILEWYNEYNSQIFRLDKKILDLTNKDLNDLNQAFDSLAKKPASFRVTGNDRSPNKIGPTGAAKILFAIRRHALIPWDNTIRKYFKYDGSGDSYANFIKQVISTLQKLKIECEKQGFDLEQLPEKLDRISSTLPKLIDEYYWVITRNPGSKPISETFRKWIEWSGLKVT